MGCVPHLVHRPNTPEGLNALVCVFAAFVVIGRGFGTNDASPSCLLIAMTSDSLTTQPLAKVGAGVSELIELIHGRGAGARRVVVFKLMPGQIIIEE